MEGDTTPLVEGEYADNLWHGRKRVWIIVGVALLTTLLVIGFTLALVYPFEPDSYALTNSITGDNIGVHLYQLEVIANLSGGSRAVLTGYNASAEFVIKTLQDQTDCKITKEYFKTAIYTELSSPQLALVQPYQNTFQLNVDFRGLRYGGNGEYNFQAGISVIPNYGCNASDFADAKDSIVLILNGQCDLIVKAMNAENAGAKAVLIYNRETDKTLLGSRVRGAGWFPGDPLVTIPVLTTSHLTGSNLIALKQSGSVNLSLQTNTSIVIADSFNVICEVEGASNTSVVMAGAHLDGVPEGPGINDNGSGSSSLLEIAIQWHKQNLEAENTIRFAWWGSEETGLIGSRNYVRDHPELKEQVALYLNFDMLASPNFYPGVFNGVSALNPKIHNASNSITEVFKAFFDEMEFPYGLAPMVSGSDFVPFADVGIPCGGLQTGAGSIKTEEERLLFGGLANAAYDPCYHQHCDSKENISFLAIERMAKAAAYVIQTLAQKEELRSFLG
eukprot:TRINITY_DN12888_c0_g1_i1.p1 TRINITY_DN12888_c0_g1~~TRINITY_DN12888_c0_g1_i1.p1  ORF type:complete len:503 (+),score=102.31 TRINITY_DN12888_c0_g1_i1:3-1511(+)